MTYRSKVVGIAATVAVAAMLLIVSLSLGAASTDLQIFTVSRWPRTVATLLAGSALAVGGLIMQILVRNRFVDATTSGSTEAAVLGLVLVAIFAPGLPVWLRMLVITAISLAGTAVFLGLVRALPRRESFTVPLLGIIFGGVLGAASTILAYNNDLIQSVTAWQLGSFSSVIEGRYELLWCVAIAAILAYVMADRLSIIGLGKSVATSVGLAVRATERLALIVVSVIAAVVVTVVGALPFVGLIVPNLVRMRTGDNARRALPWVALYGALLVLAADILSRVVRYPVEVPVGALLGVLGGGLFLAMLIRQLRPTIRPRRTPQRPAVGRRT